MIRNILPTISLLKVCSQTNHSCFLPRLMKFFYFFFRSTVVINLLVISVPTTNRVNDIYTFAQQPIRNTVSKKRLCNRPGQDIYGGIGPPCLASGLHKRSKCKHTHHRHPQEKTVTVNQRCQHGNYSSMSARRKRTRKSCWYHC